MRLLVTGAGGFLGRCVVTSALERGHFVRAMIRPTSRTMASWSSHPQVEIVYADLRDRGGFDEVLDDIDVVIHLAAAKTGDLQEQFAGTVIATENLLGVMRRKGVNKIVLTSSFAVYEYLKCWSWSVLDEDSPVADAPADRDEYCQTKLEQERLVRDFAVESGSRCVILRPGVIYGRENLWTARLGIQLSKHWWLRTGTWAPLPLTYVENCAEAVVIAAQADLQQTEVILNVVDDETPSQRAYANAIRGTASSKLRVIPIPWTVMRALARVASLTAKVALGANARVPGIFIPARLHARCKPLRYTNARIRSTLNWTPRYSWREAVERSMIKSDPAAIPDNRRISTQSVEQPA
jgi:2-alkyl-3-oxoalkanoate reductase